MMMEGQRRRSWDLGRLVYRVATVASKYWSAEGLLRLQGGSTSSVGLCHTSRMATAGGNGFKKNNRSLTNSMVYREHGQGRMSTWDVETYGINCHTTASVFSQRNRCTLAETVWHRLQDMRLAPEIKQNMRFPLLGRGLSTKPTYAYKKNGKNEPYILRRATQESLLKFESPSDIKYSHHPPWHLQSSQRLVNILSEYRKDIDRASLLETLKKAGSGSSTAFEIDEARDKFSSQDTLDNQPHIPFLKDAFSRVAKSDPMHQRKSDPANGLFDNSDTENSRHRISVGSSLLRDENANGSFYTKSKEDQASLNAMDRINSALHSLLHKPKVEKSEDEIQASLAARAANVVAVVSTVERIIPLTPSQRRSIGEAAAKGNFSARSFLEHSAATVNVSKSMENFKLTPQSSWCMVKFILRETELSAAQAAKIFSKHPWLLAIPEPDKFVRPVFECLHLLDMPSFQKFGILMECPEIIFSNADAHILPMLSRMNDLGMSESDCARVIVQHPQLMMPGGMELLAATIAFWIGQGMSREALCELLLNLPQITSMSQHLSQIKFKWLKEHVAFEIEDFSRLPKAMQLPLRDVVGPRISFAKYLGLSLSKDVADSGNCFSAQDKDNIKKMKMLNESEEERIAASSGNNRGEISLNSILNVPIHDIESYIILINQSIGEDSSVSIETYHHFYSRWYKEEFSKWISLRASNILDHYDIDMLDWLEESPSYSNFSPLHQPFLDEDMRKEVEQHMLNRELAWEQQQEREMAWKEVWRQWQIDQTVRDQLNKKLKIEASRLENKDLAKVPKVPSVNGETRYGRRRRASNFKAAAGAAAFEEEQFKKFDIQWSDRKSVMAGERLRDQINEDLNPSKKYQSETSRDGNCNRSIDNVTSALQNSSKLNHDESFVPTVGKDLNERDIFDCADQLESWMATSPHGAVTPASISLWATQHGYTEETVGAAKHLLAGQQRAFVILEPNYLYYKTPKVIWALTDKKDRMKAPKNIEKVIENPPVPYMLTCGAKNVNKMASSVLETLRQVPGGRMRRSDERLISIQLLDGLEKRRGYRRDGKKYLTNAISLLLESGFIGRRRVRGQPSGPMEIFLVQSNEASHDASYRIDTEESKDNA